MAWSTPPTVVTGDIITASWGNTLRDLFNETAPAKVTTKGDLVVASGANAIGRLGVGADGYYLTPDAAQPLGMKWQQLVSAKGDIVTATGANAKANLAVGANGKSLMAASGEATGLGYYFGSVVNIVLDTTERAVGNTSNVWTDITGVTVDLTLPWTGTIMAILSISNRKDAGFSRNSTRLVIDNTAQGEDSAAFTGDAASIVCLGCKAGLAAGTYTIKAQSKGGNDYGSKYNYGSIIAWGIPS